MEQIEGQGTDQRSDLYSLAVTLHHLLTGTVPASALTRASAQIHQELDPLRPANELNPQVPAAIANVLTQATALNRTQRPSRASAMRAMLKNSTPRATNPAPNLPLHNSPAAAVPQSLNTPPPFKPQVHPTPSPPAQKSPQPAEHIPPQGSASNILKKIFLYVLRVVYVLTIAFFGLAIIGLMANSDYITFIIAIIITIILGYMLKKTI